MSEILAGDYVLQHLAVSLVALGAAGVVARKVLGVFQQPRTLPGGGHACDHCGSAPKGKVDTGKDGREG